MRAATRRIRLAGAASGGLAALLAALLLGPLTPAAAPATGDPCAAPVLSPVACENTLPGSPPSEWDISGAGSSSIQGFATDISVDQGATVRFKIDTPSSDYRLDIYRMGYYGGDGARRVATVQPSAQLPQNQPACIDDPATGLVDCGNWGVSASWQVPGDAVSGIYFAKVVREDGNGGASHIVFVVRDDDGGADLLFQTSDTTWQAYNRYGGNSLYTGSPDGRAYKVSYNRPFTTRDYAPEDWVFNSEYPMVRWLEANGYDVSYATGIDSDRAGSELLEHEAFLSVGHDEYWSGGQRANVEAARDAGVDLGFFSGNEIFWKTRWENSIDGSGTPYRTLVSYKETHANAKIDPTGEWTGTWRDTRSFNPEGPLPENALSGNIFMVNCCSYAIQVPAAAGKMRFWRNTSIASLQAGQTATLADDTLGYEWDEDLDNGARPPGTFRLSETTEDVSQRLQDQGTNYGPGAATHAMTLHRGPGGALVFGAGTIQWPWGLDSEHDRGSGAPDQRMRQATVNLLADMGAQPQTLGAGLQPATPSTDTAAPSSSITSPANGQQLQRGNPVQIAGTATDQGGQVGGVEVSTDGGSTWHRATGRGSWTYSWTPSQQGSTHIMSRAVDDSANLETPSAGVTVDVTGGSGGSGCPCSIFEDPVSPPIENDPNGVELGVKFQADQDGVISALRFYKGAGNGGTHTGHLWSASGTLLGQATFSGESGSGWQQVELDPAVPVSAGTTYVASYYAPQGHYAATGNGLGSAVDNPPLHALASGPSGGNGVYRYGSSSGFPTQTYQAANYWVDVVFTDQAGPDTTPPSVTSVTPAANSSNAGTGADVTATFSERLDPATVNGQTVKLRTASGTAIAASVSYDAAARQAVLRPDQPLTAATTYTATISGGAGGVADLAGNRLAQDYSWNFATAAGSSGSGCPCSIFESPVNPPIENDPAAVELGVKFQADQDGVISALRFYKGAGNGGTHVGHLWSASGTLLGQATFSGESGSGWQQAELSTPVPVTAGTTYVASYYAPQGHYAATTSGFASATDNAPLHGLAAGPSGGNGVYRYGAGGGFPSQSYQATNYWVDVVFNDGAAPDTTPPAVSAVTPPAGSTSVAAGTNVTATFSEKLDPATVSGQTVKLRTASGSAVAASVSYDAATRQAVLDPDQPLADATTYTATISGGTGGVADLAGNRLAADFSWSFTTAAPPPPDSGPGGPVLVIANPSDPFSRYYGEILRAEGINEYEIVNLGAVDAATLNSHDVAILAANSLTATQAQTITTWVQGGGNLIAMRPDSRLSSLLGVSDTGADLGNAYLKVDTSAAPGAGITDQTIQYHGTADRYTAPNATAVATLYSNASTATTAPAVTLRAVGTSGGQAAAFTYDLARSVVYTRQGNPDWAGEERDGSSPIRSDDLFFGGSEPDWVDLNKVAIPQADEQQRLLANLITEMNTDRKPLPRFWYFPRGENAVVAMTGDDHAGGGTAGRFSGFAAASPAGCAPELWECVRGTSYVYPDSPLTPAEARAFEAQGFEVGAHISTGCADYTPTSLANDFDGQLADFAARYQGVPAPRTNRTHCIAWSDWASQARVEAQRGIRLDTNYYYWPAEWVQDRPGMFTGSGMPMRFADTDGNVIDTYQAATQMTDESGQSYPQTIDALLDGALGPNGFYGAFVANMHTDDDNSPDADAIVAAAQARGVPVVSARQLLEWTEGRDSSAFGSISFQNGTLSFSVTVGAGAEGLQGMVPATSKAGDLGVVRRNGTPVPVTIRNVKGLDYAFFDATPGNYEADYTARDTAAPVISATAATAHADGTATITWTTDEQADSAVDYGTTPGTLTSHEQRPSLVTSHSVTLTGLNPGTTYYYRVSSSDQAGNSGTAPVASDPPNAFTTPAADPTGTVADVGTSDFGAGQVGAGTYLAAGGDGEVTLAPTAGEEFNGSALPQGWPVNAWSSGGSAAVGAGALTLNGASAGTPGTYGAGRALEFSANFADVPYEHGGFGVDFNSQPYWAIFSVKGGGTLYARTNINGSQQETALGGNLIGSVHRYRIEWDAATIRYYVDGSLVATHAVSSGAAQMRPLFSEYGSGGGGLSVQWMRMSPYAGSGQFTSRVLDAGAQVNWRALQWNAATPAGTTLAISVRTGNTPAPDASWSAFAPVAASGGQIGSSSRYLQYRVQLSSANPALTPELADISAAYGGP